MNAPTSFARLLRVQPPPDRPAGREPGLAVVHLDPLARFYARRRDARVLLGPYTPRSIPRTGEIFLEDPRDVEPRRRERAMFFLRGFLVHECGHLALTEDLAFIPASRGLDAPGGGAAARAVRAGIARWGLRFGRYAELLEDVRVDRVMTRRHPGLERSMAWFQRDVAHVDGPPLPALRRAPPAVQLGDAILLVGRGVLDVHHMPLPLRLALDATGGAFAHCLDAGTERDVVERLASLFERLEALARRADRTRRGPPERAEEVAHEILTTDVLPPHRACCDGLCADAVARPSAPPHASPRGADANDDPALPYSVATTAFDRVIRYTPAQRAALRPAFQAVTAEARRAASRLIEPLTALLLEAASERPVSGLTAGPVLDPRDFAGVVAGTAAPDVWSDVRRAEGGGAAVAVLVDCSGSMQSVERVGGPTRAATARLCAAAIHLALAPAGVPHLVAGFTSYDPPAEMQASLRQRALAGERLERHARVEDPLAHHVFKEFDGDPAAIAAIEARAPNFDGEAVAWAAGLLLRRPERRRVLLVLSDGVPGGDRKPRRHAQHLRDEVRRAEAAGVRVVGVGIATDAVLALYGDAVHVPTLDALPAALLGALKRALTRR